MNVIGGVTISDILDFAVTSYSSSLKVNSPSPTTRRELFLFDIQSNADELQVSYDIHTFSSVHDTDYSISGLETSVGTGQFVNLVQFYSLENNISTFEDMVSISIVCTSKLVPSVQPSPSSPFSTTINNTSILYNSSSVPSMYNSNIPTDITIAPSIDHTVCPSSNTPIIYSSSPSTEIPTSFNDSSLPTIVPSKAPHIKPSYKPSTALSVAPSVRPGDPTLTPTGKMMIVQNILKVL